MLDLKTTQDIATAAAHIGMGCLVAFPTETVYGLGADALNDAAVAKIFTLKGRPTYHPLIVHIASSAQALDYASNVPPFAARLMQAFWPGPLTVILPRKPGAASAAAGGQTSIGLRCPAHPIALALLTACNTGLAGPSANRFGRVSPTTAEHVRSEFYGVAGAGAGAVDDALLVLDGGPCVVGIESCIVDCTRGQPVLLRPGVLTRAQLSAACGEPVLDHADMASVSTAPRASGTLGAHYAPNAKVRLMNASAIQTALDVLGEDAAHIAVYSRTAVRTKSSKLLCRRMPDDPLATAQQLFSVLRDFDTQGVKLIWVEILPSALAWDGVRDRLARAAM